MSPDSRSVSRLRCTANSSRCSAARRCRSPARAGRPGRLHDVRRDDHDHLGLVVLEVLRRKQPADDRQPADFRNLRHGVGRLALKQPADREALPARQLDRRVDAPHRGPGTLTPPVVTLLFASTSLTSGRTFRLIRLSASTVGVKSSDTPNGLNSTVIAPVDEPACATGIGISPPARKLAVSPDIAVRFGSASIVIKPSWSSASSTTSIDQRPRGIRRAPRRRPSATG